MRDFKLSVGELEQGTAMLAERITPLEDATTDTRRSIAELESSMNT
jgi:hypothetical protein